MVNNICHVSVPVSCISSVIYPWMRMFFFGSSVVLLSVVIVSSVILTSTNGDDQGLVFFLMIHSLACRQYYELSLSSLPGCRIWALIYSSSRSSNVVTPVAINK
jgi:hypothetical protein